MKIPRFRQRSLHTRERRLGTLWRRWFSKRFVRVKDVRIVHLNGKAYKRLTLPDTGFAEQVARNVAVFREFEILPRVFATEDRELVVEFVAGEPMPEPPTPDLLDRYARFFATLYSVGSRRIPLAESGFDARLRDDLEFLRDVGVLSADAHRDLSGAAERLATEEVFVGFDYRDALAKNFIVRPDGRLVGIDVEDLEADILLGTGLAKALLRGLGEHRQELLNGIAKHADVDLRPSMPYVELCFTASWTKHTFLKGRHTLVDPAHFDRFR
jgi:hypothetical protein